MPVWGWVAIGCGAALVLGLIVVGVLAAIGFKVLTSTQCPPGDFPRPASAQLSGWHVFQGTPQSTCDVTWTVDQSSDQVSAYYSTALARGDWHIVGGDSQTGTVSFERVSDPGVAGDLTLLGHGAETDVRVHFTSNKGSFGK